MEPRTERHTNDAHTGKPCLHLSDVHGTVMQIHAREQGVGFFVSILQPSPLPGLLPPAILDVELTPDQTNAVLREVV